MKVNRVPRQGDSLRFGLQCLEQPCGGYTWKWLYSFTESHCRSTGYTSRNVFMKTTIELFVSYL